MRVNVIVKRIEIILGRDILRCIRLNFMDIIILLQVYVQDTEYQYFEKSCMDLKANMNINYTIYKAQVY